MHWLRRVRDSDRLTELFAVGLESAATNRLQSQPFGDLPGRKVRAANYRTAPVLSVGRPCHPLAYSPAATIEQGRYRSFDHFKSPVTTAKEPSAIKIEYEEAERVLFAMQ
jgi:hypothetical protein